MLASKAAAGCGLLFQLRHAADQTGYASVISRKGCDAVSN